MIAFSSRARHRIVPCLLALALLGACDEGAVPTATAGQTATNANVPLVAAVEAQALGDGLVGLRARATDPDKTPLTFAWRVSAGDLATASGSSVLWRAPKAAGTYTVTVDVTNAKGAKATGTQTFTVDAAQQVTASGALAIKAQPAAGGFPVASPLGSVAPNPPVVGANPDAPAASAPVPQAFNQPVFAQVTARPAPLPPVLQPIATPTPGATPQNLPPSPFPSVKAPTPEPGVPIPPPLRWVRFDPAKVPATDVSFKGVFFQRPTRGWFIGTRGTVLLYDQPDPAVEPAMVFRNTLVPNTAHLSQIHFTSDTTGFLTGDNFVMRTRDGGLNWEKITTNLLGVAAITSLVVVNEQIVMIADNIGGVFRTESANVADPTQVSWTTVNTKPGDRPGDQVSRLYAGAGVPGDATQAYFVGDAIYRYDSDAAANQQWKKILPMSAALPGTPSLGDGEGYSIAMPSASELWVGTSTGNLLLSKDGAASWSRLGKDAYRDREFNGNEPFLDAPGPIRSLNVLDSKTAFMGGFGGVYDTVDGALNWRLLGSPFFDDLTVFVETVNNKTDFGGWGVSGGSIYRYRSGF